MTRLLYLDIVRTLSAIAGLDICAPAAGARGVPPAASDDLSVVASGSTTISVGPATIAPGPKFAGVGGASGGGGGTRLLVDYPLQQRSDILDMLFKPQHGASLQHVKVEIGCDGDTTQGSEPTHARSATDIDFDRGYEVWLMEEAKARRPDIQLSGLEWGIPGWVYAAGHGMWSKTNVDYLTGWASGLRDQKGLNITALAVAYNERTYDVDFIIAMRKSLDDAGLAHVKTIAPDSWGHMWRIVADMHNNSNLSAAVDILGTHQECYGAVDQMPPNGTMELRKPLWSTELHIGEIGGVAACDTVGGHSYDLPVWDIRAGLHLARALNHGYLVANMTSTLIWTPTYSWYEYLAYGGKGLVVANTPWSGWYHVPDAIWMVAHTTQFVQPGWSFSNRNGSKLMADGKGSVVSYISTSGTDLSIVLETVQSNISNSIELQLTGDFAKLQHLYMWWSERDGSVFIEQPPLTVSAGGVAALTMLPGSVVTLTTTSGQKKGGLNNTIPPRKNFTLPYSDNFDSVPEDRTPKFTSDMHGVFTAATESSLGSSKVLQQRTTQDPHSTHSSGYMYATIIGDASWLDYEVSIATRLLPEPPASTAATATAVTAKGHTATAEEPQSKQGEGGGQGSPPRQPYLFLASHIGAYKDASSCILANKSLPEICNEAALPPPPPPGRPPAPPPTPTNSSCCCPIGTAGLNPSVIHSSGTPNPAGFVFRIDFDPPAGDDNTTTGLASAARWLLQMGKADTCGNGNKGCNTTLVANGTLSLAVGQWVTLMLSAKRQGNGTTELAWSAATQHRGTSSADVRSNSVVMHSVMVDTVEEARGGVAFGNGMAVNPVSQWDNLTVTPV